MSKGIVDFVYNLFQLQERNKLNMTTSNSEAPTAAVPTLTLNGKKYVLSELPKEAQKLLLNVKAAEGEINRLKMQLAITQTAYNTYRNALVAAVPTED
jgi:hypothetical protein